MATRYQARRLRRHYIRDWLEALDVSQAELARRMNTDKGNVTRWLDEPHRVSLHVLSGVADALNLDDAGDLLRSPEAAKAMAQLKIIASQIVDGKHR